MAIVSTSYSNFVDPNDGYSPETLFLLNLNGPHDSTTTTDASSFAHTVTLAGTNISTDQARFGGSSLESPNTNAVMNIADVAAIGTADFCAQGWVRQFSNVAGITAICVAAYPNLAAAFDSYDLIVALDIFPTNNRRFVFRYRNNGQLVTFNDTTNRSFNVWYHWAITRQSGVIRFFIDGNLLFTSRCLTNFQQASWRTAFNVQVSGNRRAIVGYHDDWKLQRGVAVYTASFTPPTSELTV